MLASVERPLLDAPCASEAKEQQEISVVFTSVEATLTALKEAGAVAKRLGARITLVVPQVVPGPSRVPAASQSLNRHDWRFSVIADQMPVETRVHLFPCRDRLDKLISVLNPKSLVVIGGRRRWWPTPEEVLAKALRRAGYEVIFAGK